MNSTRFAQITCSVSLVLLAAIPGATAQGMESDSGAVTAAVLAFHAALSSGNAEAAAKLLAPDAVVLEGGEVETRKDYVAHHLREDIKFEQAVPSRRGKTEVTVMGDVAWATSTSITQGTYQSKAMHLTGAELMVLTRTAAGWQIRAIHWSSRSAR